LPTFYAFVHHWQERWRTGRMDALRSAEAEG
jgi:hypothetical protein